MKTKVTSASMIQYLDDEELPWYVHATGADADPLVRRLTEIVEQLLRDAREDEQNEEDHSSASSDEEHPAVKQAREEGWQHGLERAYSLLETEESALHEITDPDGLNVSAKRVLDRLAKAIEAAQKSDSDEYDEPDELSDIGDRREARAHVQQHAQAATSGKEPSAPDRIRELLHVGKKESRKDLIRMLKDKGIAASNISTTIARMVAAGELLEVNDRRYLKRAR